VSTSDNFNTASRHLYITLQIVFLT